MELRRASTALLRSHGSPITNLLTVTGCKARWTIGSQFSYRESRNGAGRRTFVSTSRKHAVRPNPPTTTAPPSPPPSSTTSESSPTAKPEESPESKEPSNLSSIADSLGWTKPSRWSSRTSEEIINNGSTADSILASINEQRLKSGPAFAAQQRSNMDLGRMQDPSLPGSGPPASPLSTVLNELDRDLGLMPTGKERVPFVLKPLTGRMVDVKRNVDVGRAFKLLEQSCARNRVRADFTKQRFHERPGLKRKRLRRERWKKRFLEGFKATVGRVKQLRAQGW